VTAKPLRSLSWTLAPPTAVAIWNAEFCKPTSAHGAATRDMLTARAGDIICLAQVYPRQPADRSHTVCSGAD
jgi:hypothetical protein